MAKIETEKPEQQIVEVPFPNFYVNNVTISSNALDFAFTLMERLDEQNMTIKARMVMTPLHTKMFLSVLQSQMVKWEALNGEIKLPPRKAVTQRTDDSSNEPAQQS